MKKYKRNTRRLNSKSIRHSKKKTKKINKYKENCSPRNKKGDVLDYTCYTKQALINIKKVWNMRHPDSRIKSNNPYKVWKQLQEKFSGTCKKESCWLKHKCIKEDMDHKMFSKLFAPKMPKSWKRKPNEWLSSIDIINVMKQYEESNKDFEFLGPSPIDYDTHKFNGECIWEELCEFNLNQTIKNGKRKIGIIFNLDPHYKQGSHWVALFIDTYKGKIYYFDSYGEEIPKQIKKFIHTVEKQSMKIGKKYTHTYNKKRHQYGDSECGMYCLYIIIELIKGKSFKQINKYKITDKKMLNLRKQYFNE